MNQVPAILHLSDLQFGKRNRFRNGHRYVGDKSQLILLQRLLDDLETMRSRHGIWPTIVVVSGDIAEEALREEYERATEFFTALFAQTGIPTDRLIVVPGNHDVNWKLCGAARLQAEARGEPFAPPHYSKFEFFAKFYDDLYHGVRVFSEDVLFSCHSIPELGLLFVALNSCFHETDTDHYGFVGIDNLQKACQAADQLDPDRRLYRVAVLHHNYFRQSSLDQENLRDADELRMPLLHFGFRCLLHGHRHVADMRIDKDPETNSELVVLSTGSAGLDGETLPDHPNQYQLISLSEPNTLTCYLRRFSQQTFGASGIGQWLADSTMQHPDGVVRIRTSSTLGRSEAAGPRDDYSDGHLSITLDRASYSLGQCPVRLHVALVPPYARVDNLSTGPTIPVHHILVLDVSGSMQQDNKYPYTELALCSYVALTRSTRGQAVLAEPLR